MKSVIVVLKHYIVMKYHSPVFAEYYDEYEEFANSAKGGKNIVRSSIYKSQYVFIYYAVFVHISPYRGCSEIDVAYHMHLIWKEGRIFLNTPCRSRKYKVYIFYLFWSY